VLCESCGERPATVHLTRVINDKKIERHLCERCAKEEGEFEFMFELEPKFSINELLSGFLKGSYPKSSSLRPGPSTARCESCGLSYSEFAREGKLGCDHCYEPFSAQLEPLMRKIQGHVEHTGKQPGGAAQSQTAAREHELEELRQALNCAVDEERYEEAAVLRDRIRELERGIVKPDSQNGGTSA
jgi:protein arginine kinase activator